MYTLYAVPHTKKMNQQNHINLAVDAGSSVSHSCCSRFFFFFFLTIFTFSNVIHQSENSHLKKYTKFLNVCYCYFDRHTHTHTMYTLELTCLCVFFLCDSYTRDLNLLKLNLCEKSVSVAPQRSCCNFKCNTI